MQISYRRRQKTLFYFSFYIPWRKSLSRHRTQRGRERQQPKRKRKMKLFPFHRTSQTQEEWDCCSEMKKHTKNYSRCICSHHHRMCVCVWVWENIVFRSIIWNAIKYLWQCLNKPNEAHIRLINEIFNIKLLFFLLFFWLFLHINADGGKIDSI